MPSRCLVINVVLIARREDRLVRLATELGERHGVETRIVPVDLASEDFLPVVAEATHDLDVGLLDGVIKKLTDLSQTLCWEMVLRQGD